MTFHPREGSGERGRPSFSRRDFLTLTAGAGLAATGVSALAGGIGSSAAGASSPIALPRPDQPVTWPAM